MKDVILKTPYHKDFLISGSEKDRSIIGAIESNGGRYEFHIMELLQKIIKTDAICLDVGANIGAISLCLGYLAPHGRVFAFEPSSHNFGFLLRNILQNDIKNILPLNYGILNKECIVDFSYVEEVAGCSFISETGIKEGVPEIVKCTNLDTWIDLTGIRRVDFIKMDVEGSEIKALSGSLKTLNKFKPDAIIEFNPIPMKRFFNDSPSQLYEILQNIYENIYLITDKKKDLIKIYDFHQIEQILQRGKGWEDLFCTSQEIISGF